MRAFTLIAVGCLLLPASLQAQWIDRARLERISPAVEAAIKRGDCPGAVVVVVHNDQIVFREAYGLRSKSPNTEKMTMDTVFDLASVTKPMATATSIMLLIEQGKLRPSDKVAKYWPAFAANGKENVTIEHCLLHVSGLIADNSIKDYVGTRAEMMARVAALPLEAAPEARFRYSDVGFIVLGELVEKISGIPVDQFAAKNVFEPLKMTHTGYKFAKPETVPFAPTGKRDGKIIRGDVHDPRAFAMGGVAGHAGLFGSAEDLARYCRMLLRKGELDGIRVLSPFTVKYFTQPHAVPQGLRSYGWDVDTSYSAQRGELFPAGNGFGHTGFTGTSIWVEPASDTAIIILSNRVHPDDKGNVTELRRQIGTIVASALPARPAAAERSSPLPNPTPAAIVARASRPVLTGIDILRKDGFKQLVGKNVGIVTNHSGRALDGSTTIDLIHAAPGVKTVALFSPEHGIRGEKDEKIGDGKDEKTGLPIYSLYGEHRQPTPESLKGIDTLVYDIQDIGCRFYTFISTLGLVMEAAKKQGIRVIVLDRPNPIGGIAVEGPIRDDGKDSFVGFHALPLRHGMTVGELARMFNSERKIDCDLEVVSCNGWHRGSTYDHTGLTWRNPSPNMRHLTAAMLYPGVGLLETTNVSVGRGTERPFEWFGAPWIDGQRLASDLNNQRIPGVRFVPVSRTPASSVHKDKECHGVDIIVVDWAQLKPVSLGLRLATTLHRLYPKDWEMKRFNTLLLHQATFKAVESGRTPLEIEASWKEGLASFQDRRAKYLLYPE